LFVDDVAYDAADPPTVKELMVSSRSSSEMEPVPPGPHTDWNCSPDAVVAYKVIEAAPA